MRSGDTAKRMMHKFHLREILYFIKNNEKKHPDYFLTEYGKRVLKAYELEMMSDRLYKR